MANLLIFPNHLFSTLSRLPAGTTFYIIESEEYFTRFKYHKQKLVLHRASMQAIRERLLTKGFVVEYLDIQRYPNLKSVVSFLKNRVVNAVEHFELTDRQTAETFAVEASLQGITSVERTSELFLLSRSQLISLKNFSAVYAAARSEHGFLIDATGKPSGGQWALATPTRQDVPEPNHVTEMENNRYVDEALEYVARHFADNPGTAEPFIWPVTHNDARDWLADFQDDRLVHFASQFDAFSTTSLAGYHSALSSFLSIGLLTPKEVCASAISFATHKNLPLTTVERYIRQVAGWREYTRVLYFNSNIVNPESGTLVRTGIPFIDELVRRLVEYAHIPQQERIVLAQFLLMCDATVAGTAGYFLEHTLDAAPWVAGTLTQQFVQEVQIGNSKMPFLTSADIQDRGVSLGESSAEIWDSLLLRYLKKNTQKSTRALRVENMLEKSGVTVKVAKAFLATAK